MSRRLSRTVAAFSIAAVSAASLATGCGDGDSLVGGSCAVGYTLCGDRCIDLSTNPAHCGACDNACATGLACVDGMCGGSHGDAAFNDSSSDSTVPDGSSMNAADSAGEAGDGCTGDACAKIPDGGAPDGALADGANGDGANGDGANGSGDAGRGNGDATLGDGATGNGDATLGDGATGNGDATLGDGAAGNGDASTDDGSAGNGDASPGDGATGNGDASTDDGSNDDGSQNDDAAEGSDSGCPPGVYDTAAACGDCLTVCAAPTSVCAPSGLSFACACPSGLTLCGAQCIDITNDGLNCGGCGVVCPSQICQNAQCVGAAPGGIVFIGHDYAIGDPGQSSEARALSNAVFIPQVTPIHVLRYTQFADTTALSHIDSILNTYSTSSGRKLVITDTRNPSDIISELPLGLFDVLLVPDQPRAPAGVLGALGLTWSTEVTQFASSGGVVVVLDGAQGTGEMPQFVTATGLLTVTGQTLLPSTTEFNVVGPTDVESQGLFTPYAANNSDSVSISTEPNGGPVVYVVAATSDAGVSSPVVIHKAF